MIHEAKFYVEYANNFNTITDEFNTWKTMATRQDVSLFSFQQYSNVLHFRNEILENETLNYKTLKHIIKNTEKIDLRHFIVKNIKIRITKLLCDHYELTHIIIKNNQDSCQRYIPSYISLNNDNFYELKNLNIRLCPQIGDAFIFGLQYRYNDNSGVVMTEAIKSPQNDKIIQLEIEGNHVMHDPPYILLDASSTIKVNYFNNTISFYEDGKRILAGELFFNGMKRRSFHTPGCYNTIYSFSIVGGKFKQAVLHGTDLDSEFTEITFDDGNIELLSKCCCNHKCKCKCHSYNVLSSKLFIEKSHLLYINTNYDYITLISQENGGLLDAS